LTDFVKISNNCKIMFPERSQYKDGEGIYAEI